MSKAPRTPIARLSVRTSLCSPGGGSEIMQFSIEYLRETTEEYSVCHCLKLDAANMGAASIHAHAFAVSSECVGATGFQIRDWKHHIIAIENFECVALRWLH